MTAIAPSVAFDILRGNRPEELTQDIGPEIVNRAARLTLLSDLNTELTRASGRWDQSDLAIQSVGMDVGIGVTELEPFLPANICEGPHRSILSAPPESFPFVTVGAHVAVPTGGPRIDQLNTYDITLMIECYVKTGPVLEATDLHHETVVHRRILRTIEAINIAIRQTKNLHGTVLPFEGGARLVIHDQSEVSGSETTSGERYLQQGARLQYTLQRNSAL